MRAAVCSSGGMGAAASSMRVCGSRRWRLGEWLQWTACSQRACGSEQQIRHACNSMQWQQRVCGSWQEQPAAQLKWDTVMAAASRRHNCNGRRQQQRRKGQWDSRKIAMNNDYGNGQLLVKAGVGGRSG